MARLDRFAITRLKGLYNAIALGKPAIAFEKMRRRPLGKVDRLRSRLKNIKSLVTLNAEYFPFHYSRLERIEQLLANELIRQRRVEEGSADEMRRMAEGIRALIERRYAVLSDRLRVLQQQVDLERSRITEHMRDRISAGLRADEMTARVEEVATHLQGVEADLAIVNSRLRATPFMATSVFDGQSAQQNAYEHLDYVGFENIFRGPEEMIKARQRPYLRFIKPKSRVIDLGCGRGEFLELLAEAQAHGIGIDQNETMVAHCRAKGFDVRDGDALAFLRSLEAQSVDVIFSAQFVEHLDPDALYELLRLARRALSRGGTLIAETVNPHSIEALRTFYVDLTHVKPIFPEVLAFYARSAGFSYGQTFYPNGPGLDVSDPWNYGEYALVATA